MGDKIHSKVIARKANVSMIPGYDGEVKDEDECIRVSNDIGMLSLSSAAAPGSRAVAFRISGDDQGVGWRRW